jgi:integrase
MFEDYNNKPTLRINITGKGHRRNVIFIHDEIGQQLIMDYITTHPCVRDFYFCSGNVRKREKNDNEFRFLTMNYWRYWDDLKKALDMKGLNFNDFATHDFRRCFARRVWTKYKDIQVLKNILNHKDVNTTLRYLEQSGLKNIDYHYEMQTNN